MNPITLTEFGETLVLNELMSSLTDESELIMDPSYVGIHSICRGFVYLRDVSTTHNAICCRACCLRIVIPKEVDTYGKLREEAQRQINLARHREMANKQAHESATNEHRIESMS